jgi:putative oxygen-independent coproporphyrinogen III oxidase
MNNHSLLQPPPLSLYIHIPWCVRKCPYCDFNSHQAGDQLDEAAYINALMADLDQELEICDQRELHSIFFGGGTPSLFSAESIHSIIENIKHKTTLAADAEITLEANPGTFEQQKFTDFRAAGINRLSIGIQSFDDVKLARLGRIHNRAEAIKAIETACSAGFDNINLDLMFGLPGQDIAQAMADITLACDFQPAHISHYQLTIEPNTWFHKHRPVLPEADSIWEMQLHCHDLLNRNDFQQYEVSAFSKAGRQCRHNINYWRFGDYIGIGAGAHGKLTDISAHSIQRRWKQRQPAAFIASTRSGNACSGSSELNQSDRLFEFLLNALRLKSGFRFELFEQRTGIGRERLLQACNAIDPGLLVITATGLTTSARGFNFLDDVLQQLLASCEQAAQSG